MTQNIFETSYNVTKKTRIKVFFDKYKIAIYLFVGALIISVFLLFLYIDYKKDKKILLADQYIKAKIYIKNQEDLKAMEILNDLIQSKDNIYSSLAFFLILNENLITDQKKLSKLFDHVIENNNFDDDIKYLIILKKIIFKSNFAKESEMLSEVKPILKSNSIWKPHALLLLGDYFLSNKQYIKSKDFYNKILIMKNLDQNFYSMANSRLAFISNVE
jgi:hypothetical protein